MSIEPRRRADEPADNVPLALQLAARVEKADPPSTDEISEAAALATIALLDDARSRPGGPWHDSVAAWNGARIRKLVRRGRGAAWQRAQEADGVTVRHGSAEVRAFVPGPIDRVPAPVAKLQIQSTELDRSPAVDHAPRQPGLVIAVAPGISMSWGKQAAQCAHAGQRAWMSAPPDVVESWNEAERPIAVFHPGRALWDEALARSSVQIHDGGFTEIPAGTLTAVAWFQPVTEKADRWWHVFTRRGRK